MEICHYGERFTVSGKEPRHGKAQRRPRAARTETASGTAPGEPSLCLSCGPVGDRDRIRAGGRAGPPDRKRSCGLGVDGRRPCPRHRPHTRRPGRRP